MKKAKKDMKKKVNEALKKYDNSKKDLNKATEAGKKDEVSSATKIVKSSNSEAIAARKAYAAAQKEVQKAQKA
jgi:hypothetical protein